MLALLPTIVPLIYLRRVMGTMGRSSQLATCSERLGMGFGTTEHLVGGCTWLGVLVRLCRGLVSLARLFRYELSITLSPPLLSLLYLAPPWSYPRPLLVPLQVPLFPPSTLNFNRYDLGTPLGWGSSLNWFDKKWNACSRIKEDAKQGTENLIVYSMQYFLASGISLGENSFSRAFDLID